MNIFFSNRIEKLYQELKFSLFSKSRQNPFERRFIIVSSPVIKSWLMLEMAKDPDLQVAIGIEILLLDQAIEKLISKQKPPSLLELSLRIEVEIKDLLDKTPQNWPDLIHYLKISDQNSSNLSKTSEKRLIALSEKLAALFLQYGIYGGKMLELLEKESGSLSPDFQVEIWNRLFIKKKLPFLKKELEKSLQPDLKNSSLSHIHLFSLSFLPKAHYQFFLKISNLFDVSYYFLSPCQAFWSDIQSNKEQSRLKSYLQKRGLAQQEMELDEYLRDQNPLLANFGKLGREMAKLIEDSEAITESSYVISQKVEEFPQYEEFIFDDFDLEPADNLTLLKALQADLGLLRNASSYEKISLDAEDSSIQIHVASSKSREIQILYDNFLALIYKNQTNDPIALSQIIVMAPDITEYEPFIHSVFGAEDSLLKYHLMDLHMPSKNALVKEFLNLISLPLTKFCADSCLTLFSGAYFQKAHQLTSDDVDQIRQWLFSSDLRWGFTADDRDEWLKRNHCFKKNTEAPSSGTLSHCMDRLFSSLALQLSEDDALNASLERLPISGLQTSDHPLLGKFREITESLKKDLEPLGDGSKMSLKNWATYLDCLVSAYFGVSETNQDLKNEEFILLQQFDEIFKIAEKFPSDLFSFQTIRSKLESMFTKESVDFQETELNSIRFCSMLPMRAIPASIIVLIGMNEGDFPRSDLKNSLDLSAKIDSGCDYRPSKTDYDRYLFLEALLSARKYFYLSYVGYSISDGVSRSGSLVIEELLMAIEEGYLIGEKNFSEVGIKKHPFAAHDRAYFEKDSGFCSFSTFNYKLSQKFYGENKREKHCFIPHFQLEEEIVSNDSFPTVITLRDLNAFAKNPLKTYFNKALGIYLRPQETFKSDEDFLVSPLDFAIIKKSALKTNLNEILNLVEKKGVMPSGLFKEIAKKKIETEVFLLKNNLNDINIRPQDIFRVDFSESVETPLRLENGNWLIPALSLLYQNKYPIKIVGTLTEVCQKGLIVHEKSNKVDVIKVWPQFLVFACLVKNYLFAESNLIFMKCGSVKAYEFNDPFDLVENYLEHYFKCSKNPSPLIPEWVFDFVYQEGDSLQLKMDKSLNDDFHPIYNEYLHWMRNKETLTPCLSFQDLWKSTSQSLYLDLYEKWYST